MTSDVQTRFTARVPAPDELPEDFPDRRRVIITTSCRDCDPIPRVERAGECQQDEQGKYQVMHNGVKVVHGGYHGVWMAEIIRRLGGHHEPQEERAFHEVLKHVGPRATMLELGGFWAYYSLWFHSAIEGATNWVVEPDPTNIRVGQANFARNGFSARFAQASLGSDSHDGAPFCCESDGQSRTIPQVSVDDFLDRNGIDRLDVLHADIQGAELDMLHGARQCIEHHKIRFVVVSTHHHSISGDPLTHQRCREFLRDAGGHLLADHTVAESYSGDGLLVAAMLPDDRHLEPVDISYNRAENGIFPDIAYDLDEAWRELKAMRTPPRRSLAAQAWQAIFSSRRAA